ncbi:glycoside hydrolase family 2 TIM barrel-domain containing protein [uncultured Microbacterium sp.]|uniref:glycoside hydrolase family 2 TIM barrel-domain containing protein n=1 Tax=uncultured Microbacterium sp. TaxID=191216 RepID=UPI0025FC7F56|nr:glycoside hydrolase family 2 TIM barrel-domain containing protein [uncultured Microbacterium sp.]
MLSESIARDDVESREDRRASTGRFLFTDGWAYRSKVTAFQELGGSSASEWISVHLPHDALIAQERRADAPRGETSGYFPGGAFEYRRTLEVAAELAGRLMRLEFDGVYRDAAVYVNGHLAGQRAFGYSRFSVRIDPFLVFGAENEIRVECRTHLDSRWYAGAGIYRDVHLVVKDAVHIVRDELRVSTPSVDTDSAVVEIAAVVENSGALTRTYRLEVDVVGTSGEIAAAGSSPVTLLPGSRATVRRRLFLEDPALWSVDAPNLHDVLITLRDPVDERVVDEENAVVGIRSLQLDPRHGLRINGEVVKLRGACIHLDNGPLGAVSMRAAEERKIARLKEAGFNAIRSSHCPMSTALLEACDRLGMLVMDETFDVWTSAKSDYDYSFDFPEWWERDIEALVAKDFNHPSVIFYSIGNEIPETGTPIGSTWGRRLAEKVRSLDSTRFVTNGINPFVAMLDTIVPQMKARREASAPDTAGGVNTMMAGFGQMMGHIQSSDAATERTEESFAVLDAAGMNYSDARYVQDRERFPDRIIVGTETWPSSIAGNWELVQADPRVIGDFTWTGWDYLGETGLGTVRYLPPAEAGDTAPTSGFSGGFPELTAWCGDIDIIGTRRPVSYFRETVFGLRSEPYIAVERPAVHGVPVAVATPWSWTDSLNSWSWAGFEGRPVQIEVYSDADEVELLLDGAVIGRSRVGDPAPFRAAFTTTYNPGTLEAVAYTDGVETGRSMLPSASSDLRLSVEVERAVLRHDGTDLGFIEVALTDATGTVHAARDQAVTVTVEGAAVLQALGSGAPATRETFSADTHDTFDGRALAIIRPIGTGDITVTVSSEFANPVSVALTAS